MRSPSRARHWLAISAVAAVVLLGSAALARALLPVRSILGLETNAAGCTPSLTSVRYPENEAARAGRWRLARSYPEGRDEVRAATVDGRIYVGTGLTTSRSRSRGSRGALRVRPRATAVSQRPPVPVAVDHAAFVGHEGALYVFGGYVNDAPSSSAWRFSPRTGRWAELTPMRTPRGSPAAAAVGDRIVVVGGTRRERGTEGALSSVEIYDIPSGTWSSAAEMPTARHHHGAATMDGQVVVAGGRGESDLSSDAVEQFDPARGRWTSLPSLPLGAGGLALVATPQLLIAIGGGDDDEQWVTPAAWALGSGAEEWIRLADLNVPRHGHGAAAVSSGVFVFGGAPCPGFGTSDVAEHLRSPYFE